ncbi:MAG: hypothetical protein QXX79_00975 [Candidatus Bathyarchaeia archaeon]
MMQVFFVVLARDASLVNKKIEELGRLGYPYVIVCGEKTNRPNVVYRAPRGKYDAINFGLKFVPDGVDVVVFNDVDAEIHNFDEALRLMGEEDADLVFAKVNVQAGPQLTFYSFLDSLRRRIPIAASGELMLVKYDFLKMINPLKGCKAEDSYILFKILENRGKVAFCERCFVTTKRTVSAEQEEAYKRRTAGGIYQALSMCKPPVMVRLFYMLLPFISPLLLLSGRKGFYWSKGIVLGFVDYMRGDKTAFWKPSYG